MTAGSRTVRLAMWSTTLPKAESKPSGRLGLRSRVTCSRPSPQRAAGIGIGPGPGEACAIGTMRAATDEAAPPEDPPAIWFGFHGLRQGPKAALSVVPVMPYSGVLVLPSG